MAEFESYCKKCIKQDVCRYNDGACEWCTNKHGFGCPKFKNADMLIELPCKKDELWSVKVHYKGDKEDKFAIVRYAFGQNKPLKVLKYQEVGYDLLNNEPCNVFEYVPSTNFVIEKDGFTSKEEAETICKEMRAARKAAEKESK